MGIDMKKWFIAEAESIHSKKKKYFKKSIKKTNKIKTDNFLVIQTIFFKR